MRNRVVVMAILTTLGTALPAAADDVSVGGSAERLLRDAHRDLVGSGAGDALSVGGVGITVGSGEATALTRFTPRFNVTGGDRGRAVPSDFGSALKTRNQAPPAAGSLKIAPARDADIAGLGVKWSAIASMHPGIAGSGLDPSDLAVGGQLAVSGLQLDASYGRSAGLLVGPDDAGMSAGVGYSFGSLATRMGYSLVERDTPDETSLFTVGSQLALQPGLVLSGDVAYAEEEDGESSTAGVVNFKFSF